MYSIERELEKELQTLYKTEKKIKDELKRAPKGSLRISNSHSKTEYYYKQEGGSKGNGVYIKKKDFAKAVGIAQRDYNKQLLEIVESHITLIKRFVKQYVNTKPENVYNMLNPHRRKLVSPRFISDKEYVKQWLRVEYQGKYFEERTSVFLTEKGERVRSKSEKIIADKLYAMGIPYRYEYPITLANGICIYPDFTMLKLPERKEVYLEHLGLLDDELYLQSTLRKLNSYGENGIFIGDNLLITFESSRYPLSTKMLEGVLQTMRNQ